MKIHRQSLKKNFFPQRCIPHGMGSVSNTVMTPLMVREVSKVDTRRAGGFGFHSDSALLPKFLESSKTAADISQIFQ